MSCLTSNSSDYDELENCGRVAVHHASICGIHDRSQLETDMLAHFAAMVRVMLAAASKG